MNDREKIEVKPMENEQQPEAPAISVKPTWFDFALDRIVILLLLALWAIPLGYFVFQDFYPKRFDLSGRILVAMGLTLMGVFYYRMTRFPASVNLDYYAKLPKENRERLCRLFAGCIRFYAIWFLVIFLFSSISSFLSEDTEVAARNIFFPIHFGLAGFLVLWYIIRTRMLK